jgi:hypothetical protein
MIKIKKNLLYHNILLLLSLILSGCKVNVSIEDSGNDYEKWLSPTLTNTESAAAIESQEERLLPLGSVIFSDQLGNYIMIIGYNLQEKDSQGEAVLFDYMGIIYPKDASDLINIYGFKTTSFSNVVFLGYDENEAINHEDIADFIEEYKIFPIGTVLQLEGSDDKYIVFSNAAYDVENPETKFDYGLVPYPQGLEPGLTMVYANQSEVTEIYFVGFINETFLDWAEKHNNSK